MRQLNTPGLNLIKSFETLRLQSYDDATGRDLKVGDIPKGVPTIGWGHTRNVKPGDIKSPVEADADLQDDLRNAQETVDRYVKVPLKDNQYAALVSFVFNAGAENFLKSTLLKLLNKGKYDAIPKQLNRFVYYKGQISRGLVRRRAAEVAMWSSPDIATAAAIVPDTAPDQTAGAVSAKVPDAPPPSKTIPAISGISISAISTALSDAAGKLQPLAEYATTVKYIFLALAIAGAIFALINQLQQSKQENS